MTAVHKLLDDAFRLDRFLAAGKLSSRNRIFLLMYRDALRAAARGGFEGEALLDDSPRVPRCHKVRP